MLEPTKTRFYCCVLLLIGLENLGIARDLSAYGRGQYGPPIVLLRIGQGCNLHHQAIARLSRWVGPSWLDVAAEPDACGGSRARRDNVPHDTARGVGGDFVVPGPAPHAPR